MQTSDWAEEAYEWFERYQASILETTTTTTTTTTTSDGGGGGGNTTTTFNPSDFFFDLHVDDVLYQSFRSHPVLCTVDLAHWQSHDYDLLESMRGWQPMLRTLPKVPNYRLLTLLQRNLYSPEDTCTVVSRHLWSLIEGLRWYEGLYHNPLVREALTLRMNNKTVDDDDDVPSPSPPSSRTCHEGQQQQQEQEEVLKLHHSPTCRGRYVTWNGSNAALPGQIVWQTKPFCVSVYDLNTTTTCFHCVRPKQAHVVRDLTLMCHTCKGWSYCSLTCQKECSILHQKECHQIKSLILHCETTDIPVFKAILVYRAVLQQDKPGYEDLFLLESHLKDHQAVQSIYVQQATELSEWMRRERLTDVALDKLIHLFLAIDVNAFGFGMGAVGLFEHFPSYLNHSCQPNVTHCRDDDGFLRFRAIETIQPGQECCHSYVSNLEYATAPRTASLAKYKFFTCTCPRCESTDEGGRVDAVHEWKACLDRLERPDCNDDDNNNNSMTIYQRMVELAELLFPSYYVTKGWAMEECGHALLQDTRKILDAKDMLQRAKQQYEICRGRESDLVRRVEDALSKFNESSQPMAMTAPPNDDDDAAAAAAADSSSNDDDRNELIILSNGTARVLFEIKTYESPPEDCSWEMLAERIRLQFPSFQWSPHHRLYPIGYGIQSLLLSCEMPESLKEQVAQEIEDAEDSIIQHVDLVVAQEYTY